MSAMEKIFSFDNIFDFNNSIAFFDRNVGSVDKDEIMKKSQVFLIKLSSELLKDSKDATKVKKTVEHTLRRSIRGLGTSDEMKMATNYVHLILTLKLLPQSLISLDMIFNIMDAELCPITKTQRDQREVRIGQLFVFSAILFSKIQDNLPEFDTETFINKVTSVGHVSKFYEGFAFIVMKKLIVTAQEETFRNTIFPFIQQEIKSERKTLFTYFLLLLSEEKYPSICTPYIIKQALGCKTVLNKNVIQEILDGLKKNDGRMSFNFIIHDLCRNLVKSSSDVEDLHNFWKLLGEVVNSNCNSKELINLYFVTFNEIIKNVTDMSQIPLLLTVPFVNCILKPPNDKKCLEKRNTSLRMLFSILEKQKDELKSKVLVSVVERVLFYPGDISFEKFTAGKTFIRQIVSLMTEKGVIKLASKLRRIIKSTSLKNEYRNGHTWERAWQNKEKVFAVHFLNRLLKHPSVFKNQSFKIEQLTFLTNIGFIAYPYYPGADVSVEFACQVRDTLFSAVTHRVPSLSDFQHMFTTIIKNIDSHINENSKLRVKFTDDMKLAWGEMMNSVKSLDELTNTTEEEEWKEPVEPKVFVFHPLFLQLGLLLFKETSFAMDCLNELHEVYSRTMNNPDYDQWTGDVVELLLSLLSRNSQLHRNLIKCIFSHLCTHLTSENIIAILRVLDPRADANPLVNIKELKEETSDSESDSDVEGKESSDGGDSQGESSSDDKSNDDDGDEDDSVGGDVETATDRLRQAVQSALGETGVASDNESIEVENMDEEEGQRVDKALAKAFAQTRSSKSNKDKKQQAADKALTDFRIRVIDLIEVWLNTQFPKLYDVMDVMLTLLHLCGVCITDKKQAPLLARVRTCLRKLTSLKKASNIEAVSEKKIAEIFTSVIEDENRTAIMYRELAKPINDCSLLILRFVKRFHTTCAEAESSPILNVILKTLDKFFIQRNCPLQKKFFTHILNMEWICNWYLAERISIYAFGTKTRPFMRSQALDLLCTFFNNKRLIQSDINEDHKLKFKSIESVLLDKTNYIVTGKFKLQIKFLTPLQSLIKSIEQCKNSNQNNWKEMHEKLSDMVKHLKKKPETEATENTSSAIDFNQKDLFNLQVPSEIDDVMDDELSLCKSDGHYEPKTNAVLTSEKISKKKRNSLTEEESDSTANVDDTTEQKTKKRRKKHGRNIADKNMSRNLRIEAGSHGLIDGCFSQLRLPVDIDGDDEHKYTENEHDELKKVNNLSKVQNIKFDLVREGKQTRGKKQKNQKRKSVEINRNNNTDDILSPNKRKKI